MKKIALIILMLILIGCGKSEGISAVNYSSEISSSSVNASSSIVSSSSDIAMSSHDINTSSSSVDVSSSSIIISSSSVGISSSSSLKISSSSSNKIISSSSLMSSSSAEISSSSSSLMSSSSEDKSSSSLIHTSNIFLVNIDSILGSAYYKIPNGETSLLYEILANKIMSYKSYYGWNSITANGELSRDWITNEGYIAKKVFAQVVNGFIWNNTSPSSEMIRIDNDADGPIMLIIDNIVRFKASKIVQVGNYKTFVLQRVQEHDNTCNWYNPIDNKWYTSGLFATAQSDFYSKCTGINDYGL